MLTIHRSLLICIFATGLTSFSFCYSSGSFSQSSESFSKSSNSFSGSSSSDSDDSSEPAEESLRYQDEVTDYTVAYIRSSTDTLSFQKGLSKIARKQRVINWEQNQDTYIGIGRGLKKAKMSNTSYEIFKKDLTGNDYQKMKDIQSGFELD
jgi:hypothetical protein